MKYTIKTFNETEKVKEAVKEYKILGGDDFTFKPVPVLESEMRILLMDAYHLAQRQAEKDGKTYNVQLLDLRLDKARVDEFSKLGLAVEVVEEEVDFFEDGHKYIYRASLEWTLKDWLFLSYIRQNSYSVYTGNQMRLPCLTSLSMKIGREFYEKYTDAHHVGRKEVQ